MVIFCCLTVFWLFWQMVHCTNRQKHSKPLVHQSSQVYRDCTNSVPTVYQSSKTVKNSQKTVKTAKITIGVPIVTCLPRLYQQCTNGVPVVKTVKRQSKQQKWPLVYQSSLVYQDCTNMYQQCTNSQKQSKDSQNSKNNHWCTNRHRSTKTTNTVPIVKNSQNSTKMTTGVPVVTCLPRLYQQCNNSLPIVNKNLAIANRSRISCAQNTPRAFIGLNITPWPWNLD